MGFDWLKRATNPAGRGTGRDGRAAAVVDTDRQGGGGSGGGGTGSGGGGTGSGGRPDGQLIVERRHVDWLEHQITWRWLLDSHEGGTRYRNAVYGPDRKGLPARNLFRHRREYPDPQTFPNVYQGFAGFLGSVNAQTESIQYGPYPGQLGADPAATAHDDDYEYRRSRTPVPEFVAEAVEIHLAKVYDQEVSRDGPDDLKAWWKDVDGRGTPIDDWMRETLAPMLLVLGCVDVCLDHPKAPPGEKVVTRADEVRLGLDACVASYILPQNMVWYRCDAAGRYVECLVREYVNPADRVDTDDGGNPVDPDDLSNQWRQNYVRYRHWTATESVLYDFSGDTEIERVPHPFGRVPIVRLVDVPRHRTPHVGKSRYEAIAEYQREYYNRDSELILSDTLQAHPFLSGAEDFCKSDNTLSVGPGYILPMKKNPETGTYQGWEFVSPPKDPAESLRRNKADIVAMKDRRACLAPPAGAAASGGTGASTVDQSGIAKQIDASTGHKLLGAIARTLAKVERQLAEYAAMVLRNRPLERAERDLIAVTYPARFELFDLAQLGASTLQIQQVLAQAGDAPECEEMLLVSMVRSALPGLSDAEYESLDAEITAAMAAKSRVKEQVAEMGAPGIASRHESMEGEGSAEQAAGEDPTGESGGTMVTNMIPSIM